MGASDSDDAGRRRGHVTTLLLDWTDGNQSAMEELAPLVYEELRRVARRQMAGERPGHLLQPTALVNEAFLRLIDVQQVQWRSRAHFFAMAARLMRRILVEHARARAFQKRGGGAPHITFDETTTPAGTAIQIVELDDALKALATEDDRKARVVELRYFGGLSVQETAAALDVSPETVMRDWRYAKHWLLRELSHRHQRE